jgi:hypothetical protein
MHCAVRQMSHWFGLDICAHSKKIPPYFPQHERACSAQPRVRGSVSLKYKLTDITKNVVYIFSVLDARSATSVKVFRDAMENNRFFACFCQKKMLYIF